MRIGFSFGRCVRDIVNGHVHHDDVLWIIAATRISDRDQIAGVIDSYRTNRFYLQGLDRERCMDVAHRLWDQGQILQPRLQGIGHNGLGREVWADLAVTPQQTNPVIQEAWQRYRMLIALCGHSQPAS